MCVAANVIERTGLGRRLIHMQHIAFWSIALWPAGRLSYARSPSLIGADSHRVILIFTKHDVDNSALAYEGRSTKRVLTVLSIKTEMEVHL